jgi:hypothetical protein
MTTERESEYQQQILTLQRENDLLRAKVDQMARTGTQQESSDMPCGWIPDQKTEMEGLWNLDMKIYRTMILKLCKIINSITSALPQTEPDDTVIPDNFILYAHADTLITSAQAGKSVLTTLLIASIEIAELNTNPDATHAIENLQKLASHLGDRGHQIRDISIRMPPTVSKSG